jgi:phosphatidylserine/phosphatidylglycerophosphate/cardiolipin synthase-like enzyme
MNRRHPARRRITLILTVLMLATVLPARAAEVAVAFSPGYGGLTAEALVLEGIHDARGSINVAAYSFTSRAIANALVDASRRGVDVRIVTDQSSRNILYNGPQSLANAGIPVRVSSEYAVMHNKFMVIDGISIQTCSFNYTQAAADRNAENVLYIRNHPQLAQEFQVEWLRLWDKAKPLSGHY